MTMERDDSYYEIGFQDGIAAERERCVQLVEKLSSENSAITNGIAAAIRAQEPLKQSPLPPPNHKEAKELAALKRGTSNLARCYLDLIEAAERIDA